MRFNEFKPLEIEPQVLKYWQDGQILEKLRKRNQKGEKFYFLQGPPYTSGRIHLGQAWDNSLKDMVLRYKRMNGFNVWDRAGYDMHGLPTEREVMKNFSLKTKEDIQTFGFQHFAEECLKFSTEMAGQMSKDLMRLGVTLDFTDPYMPVTNEFMEGEWYLIKKADEEGRLYLGERSLQWCATCETALAKHECEYKTLNEDSIFLKFPVKGKKNEYLIIWTTTPWTIVFNMAIMVNPEVEYIRAKVGEEKWIVAKALAGVFIRGVAEKDFEILEEFKGDKLKGMEYHHPWEKEISQFKEFKKKNPNTHTVVLSEEYVSADSGSGLVHCAPGCGPEDYEVGHLNHIPPFNTLDERGTFPENMGKFAGLRAKKDDKRFIEFLKESGALIAVTKVEHEYAHCQRCHQPVVFKVTPQWFFKVEDLREKMAKANEKILWRPDAAKNAFASWLENLRDNSITKQRFWGTPVPIWQCDECKGKNVIGSIKELEKLAGKLPENLHKPWIDEVIIPCECGGKQKRIPDVLDVWIDAGTTSWTCLYYPQRKDLLKEWFPVDFILEGKDQIRGWFNMLMVASFLALGKPSFKSVYMHGFVTDVEGVKMSKSLGNIISPYEVIDKHGVDTLRYYLCQNRAGEDLNFSWDEITNKERYLNILWNVQKLLFSLTRENKFNPFEAKKGLEEDFGFEERYIISRLHRTVAQVTELMETYHLDEAIKPIEDLFLELSRNYVQLVREKSVSGDKKEKELCMLAIGRVLFDCLRLMAPLTPFVAEAIFLNLKEEYNLKEESIHHWTWPKPMKKYIDDEVEGEVVLAMSLIQAAMNGREKMNRGLRWPIAEAVVSSQDGKELKRLEKLEEMLKSQLNIKKITFQKELPSFVKRKVRANYEHIKSDFGDLSPKVIARLSIESPETILGHIDKENGYDLLLDGQKARITYRHLVIDREVPATHTEGMFREGFVYLAKETDDELESEGFARELMRATQQMRKDCGLEKSQRISLYFKLPEGFRERLGRFETELRERVGAEKLLFSIIEPQKKYQHSSVKKIKDKEFGIWFDVV